jgi:hypothetical protein
MDKRYPMNFRKSIGKRLYVDFREGPCPIEQIHLILDTTAVKAYKKPFI